MKLENIKQTKVQPDGKIINCYASGDEYFNYLHDKNGYIIKQDYNTSYYTYAKYENNKLVSSKNIVIQNILNMKDAGDIYNNLITIDDIEIKNQKIQKTYVNLINDEISIKTPNTGNINNIVIYVRFKDEEEFPPSQQYYNNLFNNTNPNTISMYNYFKSVTYDKLSITSHFYPNPQGNTIISYQEAKKREYYEPYNPVVNPDGYTQDQRFEREFELVTNAIEGVSSQISPSLNIDSNNDGIVDCVTLIIKGFANGFADILWPHKFSLISQDVYINGKKVGPYVINLEREATPSTVYHEMYHTIRKEYSPNFPDLYHYSYDGLIPVGPWDIMATTLEPPQQCCAYLKERYGGWINYIPPIVKPGRYTLNPLTSSINNSYKVSTKLSTSEYFVLEYRNKNTLFESGLPQSGLLVYRINSNESGKGNGFGPPDEVYVYRPGGSPTKEGDINRAALNADIGYTSIGGPDNPLFLSDGTPTEIVISNVGSAGQTISFDINGVPQAYLKINKEGPDTVNIGEEFEYIVKVENTGDTYSTEPTIITDVIPDELEIISVESNRGDEFIEGQTARVELDAIYTDEGEEIIVTIKVKAIKEGTIVNTASVDAENNANPITNASKTTVIKSHTQTKYTTGELISNCTRNLLKVSADNKNDVEYELKFTIQNLVDLTDKKDYVLKISKDTDNTISISDLPTKYEVIFDNIEEGIDILIVLYCNCMVSKLIREIDLKPLT